MARPDNPFGLRKKKKKKNTFSAFFAHVVVGDGDGGGGGEILVGGSFISIEADTIGAPRSDPGWRYGEND